MVHLLILGGLTLKMIFKSLDLKIKQIKVVKVGKNEGIPDLKNAILLQKYVYLRCKPLQKLQNPIRMRWHLL
jgi:hypothetical protein